MAFPRVLGWLLLLVGLSDALKFDLQSHAGNPNHKKERCIRDQVNKDQLVVVTATVDGHKGDGMKVDITIRDATGNEYGHPRDVIGESRTVFTPHIDTTFDVCFENLQVGKVHPRASWRSVELDIDIGADAKDWSAVQASQKLKPLEADLRRIEEKMQEVVDEMEYLRLREQKLRDTNESTNVRVKWFGVGTTWLLVGLWAWQIMYLRAYFRSKHLI